MGLLRHHQRSSLEQYLLPTLWFDLVIRPSPAAGLKTCRLQVPGVILGYLRLQPAQIAYLHRDHGECTAWPLLCPVHAGTSLCIALRCVHCQTPAEHLIRQTQSEPKQNSYLLSPPSCSPSPSPLLHAMPYHRAFEPSLDWGATSPT